MDIVSSAIGACSLPAVTMIGTTVLHYEIREQIGSGGMGVVYSALDTKLDRIVALKFIPPQLNADKTARWRLAQEARAAAALNHPNIATIYGIEEAEEGSFIAMEYVEGFELRHVSAGRPGIPLAEIINIAIQIADGLWEAHKKGIIHRDIKSANIMVTEGTRVKIMDFGLAKLRGQSDLTNEGSILGTVAYMSPEQTCGTPVDHRSDIWSFGVVLYELITGRKPFRGEYDQAVVYSILNEEPEPIPEAPKGAERLQAILDKTLAKEPVDRYESMGDVLTDLRAIERAARTVPISHVVRLLLVESPKSRSIVRAIMIVTVLFLAFWIGFQAANLRWRDEHPYPEDGFPSKPFRYVAAEPLKTAS